MKRYFLFFALILCTVSTSAFAFAGPFGLIPDGALPTKVYRGDTVMARYTITNRTSKEFDNCFVEVHPNNTAIESDGCGQKFNLKSGQSCVLNLIVSGEVNNMPPLFICTSDGISCSGNGDNPLIVHVDNNVPSLSLTTPTLPNKIIDGDTEIYTYKLTNTGSGVTEAIRISFSGPGNDAISLVNDQCSGKNLAPNETCNFDVKILPVDDDVASGIKQTITINYGNGL